MQTKIISTIQDSIETKKNLLENEAILISIQSCIELITTSFKNGNKVLFCGNGGSAADAQHLAAELSGRFYKDRDALPAEALHCNSSYITAIANDYSFDIIYARLINGIGKMGDVLVGLSTSGNSKNIVEAFKSAKLKGMQTIGFTGSTGGELKNYSDILINIPSDITPRIQEAHIMVGHIICEIVEANCFP